MKEIAGYAGYWILDVGYLKNYLVINSMLCFSMELIVELYCYFNIEKKQVFDLDQH